jgi:hypothetical protein
MNEIPEDWSEDKPLDAQSIAASSGLTSLLGLSKNQKGIIKVPKSMVESSEKASQKLAQLAEDPVQDEKKMLKLAKASDQAKTFEREYLMKLSQRTKKSVQSQVKDLFRGKNRG